MDLVTKSMVEQFQRDRDLGSLSEDEAFEAFAGFCVLSAYYESEFSPDAFRVGGGNDLGIDVFGLLVNGELLHDSADMRAMADQAKKLDVRIIVVQAKTTPGFETKVVADLADNLRHVLGPDRLPYEASADILDFRKCLDVVFAELAKLSDGLPRLHVRYVTTGEKVAAMVAQKAASAEKQLLGLGRFQSVDFQCVTRHELRGLYQRATQAVSVTFTMVRQLALPRVPGVRQSYLGFLPAQSLVRCVLTDRGGGIRRGLFHENVRDFLGEDNDVNREIRDTLRDPVRRERFAVFNNGITIVTRDLTVAGDEFHLKDFQIVNGCQTCHVLFHERALLTDAVHVSVRIVHSQDEEVIGGIVGATNRQTAISEDDLSAREEFHRRLEDYFVANEAPRRLYYERRSRQYSPRNDVEKTRVISRPQLTRAYVAMFLGEPAEVGHYAALLRERKNDLYRVDHQPVVYYTAAAAAYRLEWMIRNRYISKDIGPARYHLLAAIKLKLLGTEPLPAAPKKVHERCERILETVWDMRRSERLMLDLLPAVQRSIDAELAAGVPLGEMVRTERFAERVRREVLGQAIA